MHPLAIAPELRAGITDEQRAEWLECSRAEGACLAWAAADSIRSDRRPPGRHADPAPSTSGSSGQAQLNIPLFHSVPLADQFVADGQQRRAEEQP